MSQIVDQCSKLRRFWTHWDSGRRGCLPCTSPRPEILLFTNNFFIASSVVKSKRMQNCPKHLNSGYFNLLFFPFWRWSKSVLACAFLFQFLDVTIKHLSSYSLKYQPCYVTCRKKIKSTVIREKIQLYHVAMVSFSEISNTSDWTPLDAWTESHKNLSEETSKKRQMFCSLDKFIIIVKIQYHSRLVFCHLSAARAKGFSMLIIWKHNLIDQYKCIFL